MRPVLLFALLCHVGIAFAATVSIKVDGTVNPGSYAYTGKAGDSNLARPARVRVLHLRPGSGVEPVGRRCDLQNESAPDDYISVTLKLADGTTLRPARRGTGNHHTQLYRNYRTPAYTDHVTLLVESNTYTD